jgi:hypothetical protein
MTGRRAFVDESYAHLTAHYLMAAVVLEEAASQEIADLAAGLRRRARGEFHWRHEFDASRRTMLELVAVASDVQIVVVSQPVASRRQERARARCTESLLSQLRSLSSPVRDSVLESRGRVLDQRDAHRIEGLRVQGRADPELRYSFDTKAQPLLWLADAVAGAATSDLTTGTQYLDRLKGRLYRVEIPGAV